MRRPRRDHIGDIRTQVLIERTKEPDPGPGPNVRPSTPGRPRRFRAPSHDRSATIPTTRDGGGPPNLLRHDQTRAAAIGPDRSFAEHSLRSGFAPRATAKGHRNSPSCATAAEVGKCDAWLCQLVGRALPARANGRATRIFCRVLPSHAPTTRPSSLASDNCPCHGVLPHDGSVERK